MTEWTNFNIFADDGTVFDKGCGMNLGNVLILVGVYLTG